METNRSKIFEIFQIKDFAYVLQIEYLAIFKSFKHYYCISGTVGQWVGW